MSKERSFGERLRDLRRAKGWSQLDASKAFGVRESTVANWEAGRHEPSGPAKMILEQLEAEPPEPPRAQTSTIRISS